MSKRVCCVIAGVGTTGGAERVMSVLCSKLAKMGVEVQLIVQEKETPAYPLDERVVITDTSVKCRIPFLRLAIREMKLRRLVRNSRPVAVISFITRMNILTLLATAGLGIPVFVSDRVDPKVYHGTVVGRIRNWLYRMAAGVICQTQEAMDYYQEPIRGKCTMIENPLSERIPEKLHYMGVCRFVAVGRLTSQKNYNLLLSAFSKFLKKHHDSTLDIFGDGCQRDCIQKKIEELGISANTTLRGSVPDVMEQIKTADLFVMTSDVEGMPNALAEAMAIGLPCISTDCDGGGAKALIQHRVNGILVPKGNEEELLEAMEHLVAHPQEAEEIGKRAKEVRQYLGTDRIAKLWISLCQLDQ